MGQYANGVTYGFDSASLVGDSPTYENVGEIYNVAFGGMTADAIDTTVHGDTWRNFEAGLRDAGSITLGVRFSADETVHKSLLDQIGTKCAHKVEFPLADASSTTPFSIEVDGIVQTAAIEGPHDGLLDMTVTLKLSGSPTITAEAV